MHILRTGQPAEVIVRLSHAGGKNQACRGLDN
jgi:hypothetical protein